MIKKYNKFITESIINREILDVSNYNLNWLSYGDEEGFESIERNQVGFDPEKGFADFEIIIKRISDGKFFKGKITQLGHNGTELAYGGEFKEVLPKTRTKIYYEWP